ncbi:TrlF family AAA-like ATPase [Endothiovibrio diazotrophicus]
MSQADTAPPSIPTPDSSVGRFPHGSEWVRADFHLHTRADREFSPEARVMEKHDYRQAYVAALRAASIRLGVVTNHNKFDREEFKELEKAAEREGIALFPGLEFSLREGIHLLIVFSHSWYEGEDRINNFLNAAFLGIPNYDAPNYPNSRFDLQETVAHLDVLGLGYFLMLAHVDDTNGLFKVLKGRTLEQFVQQEAFRRVLAIQKSGNLQNYQRLCQLAGREIACVQGSDRAHEGIGGIGQGRSGYLKLGSFDFEAVRFALGSAAERVAREAPSLGHSHIEAVRFEGGLLEGRRYSLNPGLNCLIGIRGSGKSSLLEAIRFAIGLPFGEKAQDREYKEKLLPHLVGSGGVVVVEARNHLGQVYEVRRIVNHAPDVYREGAMQPGVQVEGTVLRKPLYFGQKDLSATGEGFERDLVEKLVGDRLGGIRERIRGARQAVVEAVRGVRWTAEEAERLAAKLDELSGVEHQLGIYAQFGIEARLKEQLELEKDLRHCARTEQRVEALLRSLEEMLREHEDDIANVDRYRSEVSETFLEGYRQAFAPVREGLSTLHRLIDENRAALTKLRAMRGELETRQTTQKQEFAEVERQIAGELKAQGHEQVSTDEFKGLSRRQVALKQQVEELGARLAREHDREAVLAQALAALNEAWLQEFRTLEGALAGVNEAHGALRIETEFKGDRGSMEKRMEELFRGTGVRKDAFGALVEKYVDFGAIYRDLDEACKLARGKAEAFRERFLAELEALLTHQVENHFEVRYHDKPLRDHSLGQRASALMLFILSQRDNDLVLIDQPEDDLDNQTLYQEVIKLIKQLKPQMQFIFATHNANIPVLGDAEQILACRFEGEGMMVESGSVDDPRMQRRVVDVMEGGEEAFNERKRIYESWTLPNC